MNLQKFYNWWATSLVVVFVAVFGTLLLWMAHDLVYTDVLESGLGRRDREFNGNLRYIEFGGHQYVIFDTGAGSDFKAGLTHSPKCECLRKGQSDE